MNKEFSNSNPILHLTNRNKTVTINAKLISNTLNSCLFEYTNNSSIDLLIKKFSWGNWSLPNNVINNQTDVLGEAELESNIFSSQVLINNNISYIYSEYTNIENKNSFINLIDKNIFDKNIKLEEQLQSARAFLIYLHDTTEIKNRRKLIVQSLGNYDNHPSKLNDYISKKGIIKTMNGFIDLFKQCRYTRSCTNNDAKYAGGQMTFDGGSTLKCNSSPEVELVIKKFLLQCLN